MPYESELAIAKEAVRKACQLCSAAQAGLVTQDKLDKADKSPVTVADYGAQAVVFNLLKQNFPDIPAVGEEDSGDLQKEENAELLARIVEYAQKTDDSLDQAGVLAAIDHGGHSGGPSGRFWTLDPIDGT
ncbi:MAG: inositol monophosphatase family protein, partial [Verrucomicrobiota bacterium]